MCFVQVSSVLCSFLFSSGIMYVSVGIIKVFSGQVSFHDKGETAVLGFIRQFMNSFPGVSRE
jgi:hypothetical protein